MDHSKNTKVYKFDLSLFKKNTFKSQIAGSIFIVISLILLLFIYYVTAYGYPILIVISLILYIRLLYLTAKNFIAYSRADKTHKNDSITIYKEDNQIVSVDIKMQETKYDEFYSIKTITKLHRKNYIDVEGVIYNENSSDDATDLRIPPYFEDMDEIYEALEKMKEQA